jgi:multiple sugar transport system substrate-binding protein
VKPHWKRIKLLLGVGLVMALLLSACESLPFEIPWLVEDTPSPTQPADVVSDLTPTPDTTPVVDETPAPVTSLTVWVPPEMDPNLESVASILFANQLLAFSEANGGIEINVRIKAASGAGGLLDALAATNAAAPGALPDVIALSRPDLESAALKGLIFSLDGMTDSPDDPDWYSFARDMALIQGSTFGLPFAADALVLVYRSETLPVVPATWVDLFGTQSTDDENQENQENQESIVLAFATEHDQALFPMALYLAEGVLCRIHNDGPLLEVEPLTEVFRILEQGVVVGTFPDWLNQYQTSGQVWTAFKEGQVDFAVTWVSNFLLENPDDAVMVPLFPGSEGAVSLGTGMSWALSTPEEHRQPLAAELAEFLVQPDYLAEWTKAAGYIPPRPSSLDSWQNNTVRTTVSQVALMTRLRPSNEIVLSLGPILREGTRQILQGLVDPAQAAQLAIESLVD